MRSILQAKIRWRLIEREIPMESIEYPDPLKIGVEATGNEQAPRSTYIETHQTELSRSTTVLQ